MSRGGYYSSFLGSSGTPCVPRHVFDDALEPGRIVDQPPPALGEDRDFRGRLGHPYPAATRETQSWSNTSAGSPPRAPRQIFARAGSALAQHWPAPAALAAVHSDQESRGPMPERLVVQPASHHVAGSASAPIFPGQPVRFDHAARNHRAPRPHALADSWGPSSFDRQNVVKAGPVKVGRGRVGASWAESTTSCILRVAPTVNPPTARST